jgi:hypothetical protein
LARPRKRPETQRLEGGFSHRRVGFARLLISPGPVAGNGQTSTCASSPSRHIPRQDITARSALRVRTLSVKHNATLKRVALSRLRWDARTRDYLAHRIPEGRPRAGSHRRTIGPPGVCQQGRAASISSGVNRCTHRKTVTWSPDRALPPPMGRQRAPSAPAHPPGRDRPPPAFPPRMYLVDSEGALLLEGGTAEFQELDRRLTCPRGRTARRRGRRFS